MTIINVCNLFAHIVGPLIGIIYISILLTTGTRIPDPPFSSFGPSCDYGMDLCLEVYL